MKINKLYPYKTYPRVEGKQGRCYAVNQGRALPSVTTILSKTSDKSFLKEWRQRVGEAEADRIVRQATSIGNRLHENLEEYILQGTAPIGNMLERILTKLVIEKGLVKVDEVWGTEVALFSNELYAGTTDLVGVFEGEPAIMDFKNSLKIKKKEWIGDYFLQMVAYANSHNEMYQTNIQKGVIMMACRTGDYLEFVIEGDEFKEYSDKWYEKLYAYYETYGIE